MDTHVAYLLIALTVIVDGLAGLAGGLLSEVWLLRRQAGLIGFAAGAILAAAFLDVFPEAIGSFGPRALAWAFWSFVAFAILEWSLGHHHRTVKGTPPHTLPATLLLSDALHNVSDGAAVAAAFLVSLHTGVVVAVAVIVHEMPEEVGDYAVLRAARWPRGRALGALALIQCTAALGALGIILGAARSASLSAAALSIAAGTFLYIGATDLLPEVHSGTDPGQRRERMAGFLGGIALIAAGLALDGMW